MAKIPFLEKLTHMEQNLKYVFMLIMSGINKQKSPAGSGLLVCLGSQGEQTAVHFLHPTFYTLARVAAHPLLHFIL